jgi:hypothetical protein
MIQYTAVRKSGRAFIAKTLSLLEQQMAII